jgi:Fe-S oxidoreductase
MSRLTSRQMSCSTLGKRESGVYGLFSTPRNSSGSSSKPAVKTGSFSCRITDCLNSPATRSPRTGCCQRPKISHGFLREAKKEGTATIEGLRKYLDQGLKVVVCEPSCASALNDDLPDLIDDEVLADKLKEQVMMIDVFLYEEIKKGELAGRFESIAGNLLIHGHCHQKALYSTEAMKSICSATGRNVEEIPSGCCGMAGSFGYEKEHYDLSGKIGESILFPAVRSMKEGTTLVASGFSCRHQIEHFTGIKPKHWVEVVRGKGHRIEGG